MGSVRDKYQQKLGYAARSLRAERGFRSVAEFSRQTGFPASAARRVEGTKEPEKGLTLDTVEAYAQALRVHLGELFTRADRLADGDPDDEPVSLATGEFSDVRRDGSRKL